MSQGGRGTDDPKVDRKAHVERFHGKDASEGSWVDVEFIDRLNVNGNNGKYFRHTQHNYLESSKEMANRRKDKEIKVTNPEDKSQFVEIKVYTELNTRGRDVNLRSPPPPDDVNWGTRKEFDNDEHEGRTVELRKIVHLEVAEAFLDTTEDKEGQPPKDPEDYKDAVEATREKDKEQYVYVEVVKEFQMKRDSGMRFQTVKWALEIINSKLLRLQDGEENKVQGRPSSDAVRLDPLQNIVNVSWADGLAVEFYPKDT